MPPQHGRANSCRGDLGRVRPRDTMLKYSKIDFSTPLMTASARFGSGSTDSAMLQLFRKTTAKPRQPIYSRLFKEPHMSGGHGGRRAGAGRPSGSGWKPAIIKMRAVSA